jgi:hypothetical protein
MNTLKNIVRNESGRQIESLLFFAFAGIFLAVIIPIVVSLKEKETHSILSIISTGAGSLLIIISILVFLSVTVGWIINRIYLNPIRKTKDPKYVLDNVAEPIEMIQEGLRDRRGKIRNDRKYAAKTKRRFIRSQILPLYRELLEILQNYEPEISRYISGKEARKAISCLEASIIEPPPIDLFYDDPDDLFYLFLGNSNALKEAHQRY